MNLQLNSNTTFYLLLTLSITSFVVVVLFWGKIFRKGLLNLFSRTLILLLIQVLILVSVGVGINRSQGFYSSWTDLFGGTQDFTSAAISTDALSAITLKEITGAKKFGNSTIAIKQTIKGSMSGVSNIVYLLLPTSAAKEIKAGRVLNPNRFQIVEFLTGFPSKPEMWFKALSLQNDVATYNSTHRKAIIGVIPEINVAGQKDLECMNLPNGEPAAETWLTSDMKSFLDKKLGFTSNRWFAAGVSTGGWCAYMFAINHTEQFSGALSIAGYYRAALPLKDPIALQNKMIAKYNVTTMEAALQQKVPLYVTASLGDKYSIRETTRFLAKPHPNLEIKYHEIATGGHNPRVWKSSITPGLNWLASKAIN